MRKPYFVSYGCVGRRWKTSPLESFIPSDFMTGNYDGGGLANLQDALRIFNEEAPEINAYADGDEFLPICVAVHYVLNIDGHNNYLDNVEYVLYDGDNWYIPLKENAVKKTSKEEAVLWVQQYMKAVESYEDRVNAAPPVSLEVSMFGGDKAAYPTKDELDAMPKNE